MVFVVVGANLNGALGDYGYCLKGLRAGAAEPQFVAGEMSHSDVSVVRHQQHHWCLDVDGLQAVGVVAVVGVVVVDLLYQQHGASGGGGWSVVVAVGQ